MSEELFDGHVVSNLSVGEAWARKILLSPLYVCAAEGMDATYYTYKKKIESTDMTDEERKSLKKSLAAIREDWENIGGVPSILQKHLPQDVKRIIIFCPDIYSTNRYRKLVQEWMGKAGIQIHRTYIIESKRNPSENMKEMEHFQEDGFDGVKVMISVNMLNEGIHVPRVDAVIMLRNTVSGNIYLQQLGRCMHTGVTNHRPVVFDLVNNIISAFTHDTFAFERAAYNEALEDLTDEEKERGAGHFIEVVDYLMDTRELLAKMDDRMAYLGKWAKWDKNYEIAKEFYDANGRFPTHADIPGIKKYFRAWEREQKDRHPEMLEKLQAIGYSIRDSKRTYQENLDACKLFYAKHGRLPLKKDDKRLYMWAQQVMKRRERHKEITDELLRMGYRIVQRRSEIWDRMFEACKAYYEKNGCFPIRSKSDLESDKLQRWMVDWAKRCGDKHPEKLKMLKEIGFKAREKSFEDLFAMAEELYKKNGHFPSQKENEALCRRIWKYMRGKSEDSEEMRRLKAIGYQASSVHIKWNENYLEAKSFYLSEGRFPTFSDNKRISMWALKWFQKSSSNHPEKLKMLEEIGFDVSKYKSKKK